MATARRAAPSRAAESAAPARGRTAARPSGASDSAAPRTSYRGAAGLRQMEEEQAKADARKAAREATFGAPFRFFCMAGESREIVVVDEAPDFFRHEHALQDRRSKRYDNFVPCIDEHANCPVCAVAERPAYFAMYLTIIDLTPYINKDGDEVEFSKKLLVVKPTQQKKIMRLYDRHKSLRGMVLQMTRDSKEDAQIGNDIEFVEFMDEEELLGYETDYTDKEGKVHPVIAHEPYDYEKIFPDMTEKQLRAVAGGRPAEAGSRESNRDALGNDDAWGDEPRAGRTASRRGAAPADDGQDDAPAPAPRRGARSVPAEALAAPARRTRAAAQEPEAKEEQPAPRSRRAAPAPVQQDDDVDPETGLPWDDDQQGDVEQPADPAPARRAARTTRSATPAEEDAPQRPASSVAARRASLRRA